MDRINIQLTRQQKEDFVENGFLHIPSAVPPDRVHAALRAINHSIGEVGKTGADPARYRVDSHCHELRHAPVLTDVFNRTAVRDLTKGLLGPGNVQPVEEVQIAARFPLAPGVEAPPIEGHLDATGTGTNGAPTGSYLRNFTVIAVVYLVDVPAPYCGNFTVWPGSHIESRNFFRRVGHEVLVEGDPDIEDLTGKPVMLTGRAGDAFLCHHLIQHTGGPNLSPNVRHAVISRIKHRHVDELDLGGFTDMWREWEGLADLTAAHA